MICFGFLLKAHAKTRQKRGFRTLLARPRRPLDAHAENWGLRCTTGQKGPPNLEKGRKKAAGKQNQSEKKSQQSRNR